MVGKDLKMQARQEALPPFQQALQELRSFLVDEMVVSDVIDYIIEVHGLTADEEEQIEVTQGKREKMRKLLNCLRSKDIVVFNAMVKGLKANRCDHVVKRLQEKIDFINQLKQDPSLFDEDPSRILAPQDEPDASPIHQGDWLQQYPENIQHSVPSDRLLTRIALALPSPTGLGGLLSLPYSLSQQCVCDHPHNVVGQIVALLQAWKRGGGREASLERLVRALESGKLLSEEVQKAIEEELKEEFGQTSQIPRQSGQSGQRGRGLMKNGDVKAEVWL